VKYKESPPLDSTDSDSNNESSLENSSSESGAEDDLISPSIDHKSSEIEPYFGLQGNLSLQFGGLTQGNRNDFLEIKTRQSALLNSQKRGETKRLCSRRISKRMSQMTLESEDDLRRRLRALSFEQPVRPRNVKFKTPPKSPITIPRSPSPQYTPPKTPTSPQNSPNLNSSPGQGSSLGQARSSVFDFRQGQPRRTMSARRRF